MTLRRIALITQVLAPGAEPRWAADAVADADIVVLAIPLHKFADVRPRPGGRQARRRHDELLAAGRRRPGDVRGSPVRQQRDRRASAGPVDGRQDASTTSATTNSRTTAGLPARRNAGRSASPATTLARWTSWRRSSSASATTPSGWTASAPAASSNPAARSSVFRCADPSSSGRSCQGADAA